jgi:SM-20-related protein
MSLNPNLANHMRASAQARCPHLVFAGVLGAARVGALLDYVSARRDDFKPAVVRNRQSGDRGANQNLRDCLSLRDLDVFLGAIDAGVRSIAGLALDQLRVVEPAVEPREFELTAFQDGGHFRRHIDTDERVNRVRVLSCVYYFAATPRRFHGGELRLYGLPRLSAGEAPEPAPYVDVAPETDSLVVFPSWLRHEVLPVSVPSRAWADARFTINCWLHRRSPPDGEASVAS